MFVYSSEAKMRQKKKLMSIVIFPRMVAAALISLL